MSEKTTTNPIIDRKENFTFDLRGGAQVIVPNVHFDKLDKPTRNETLTSLSRLVAFPEVSPEDYDRLNDVNTTIRIPVKGGGYEQLPVFHGHAAIHGRDPSLHG